MLYKPTSAAYAADRAPEGMQGRYQSLYSSASIGGMVIAPPLGGYVYQHAPGCCGPSAPASRCSAPARLLLIAADAAALPLCDDRIPRQLQRRYRKQLI